MSLTMYTATVPTCTRALNNLAAILEKAAAHAEARKIDPAVLLNTRLYPDMFPLSTQIHIANELRRAAPRGSPAPRCPRSKPRSGRFAEWIAATRETVAYLQSLKPAQFEGSEDKTITWQTRTSHQEHAGHALPVPSRAAERVFPRHHRV